MLFSCVMFAAPSAFVDILRERMFKSALSTIIAENTQYLIALIFIFHFVLSLSNIKDIPFMFVLYMNLSR